MGDFTEPPPMTTQSPRTLINPNNASAHQVQTNQPHTDPPNESQSTAKIALDRQKKVGENEEKPKMTSKTCKPVAERPKIELPSQRINTQIQYMKDHALIGKFIGFWPTEKALQGWIAAKWKPKGNINLKLRPKGFLTAIFNCIEDRNRVLDNGPYFFNAAGLYLRNWVERFNPDKEDLSSAPVWIRLYCLPLEYWDEETLKDIRNGLGDFIKVAEETKNRRYTSYARIYIYMHLNKALSDSVSIYHDDFEWIQTLDYEHVPFRCRKCHAHQYYH